MEAKDLISGEWDKGDKGAERIMIDETVPQMWRDYMIEDVVVHPAACE